MFILSSGRWDEHFRESDPEFRESIGEPNLSPAPSFQPTVQSCSALENLEKGFWDFGWAGGPSAQNRFYISSDSSTRPQKTFL